MIRPVLFMGMVKFLETNSKRQQGPTHYCIARLEGDGQKPKGLYIAARLEGVVKAARSALKAGSVKKVVFEPPQGHFLNSNGKLVREFDALSYEDLNLAQTMLELV